MAPNQQALSGQASGSEVNDAENRPTLHGMCPQHAKPLRGLMSTPSARQFSGRFGRMFALPAATYGRTNVESKKALELLGAAMTSSLDEPKDGVDAEESGIPALYTYFGQFVDHDITFDPVSTLTQRSDPDGLTDFRTPALDLDNMYGRGPDDQPYMYNQDGMKFLLGNPLSGNDLDPDARDLPCNSANPARALIGDPRNDENSIISQFQGLMLRFHNRVVDDNPTFDFATCQRLVRWHYQWVVAYDFLRRIVSPSAIDSLQTNGRYDSDKINFYDWKSGPFMPVEFSVAAYRLGHSMIRPGYRLNNATLLPIFPTVNNSDGLTGFTAMGVTRAIDWARYIDIERRAGGAVPPDTKPPNPSPEQSRRLQFAYRLDPSVVAPLANLPLSVAPDAPPSLAQRNLLRSFSLGLPTGQCVARAMGIKPLTDDQIIIGKAVDPADRGTGDVLGPIAQVKGLSNFAGRCTLWTYILAEAMQNPASVKVPVINPVKANVTTPQLGEVGGRIVAEVILGMLFADKDSFLSADPQWRPTIKAIDGDFKLRDIVAYVLPPTQRTNGITPVATKTVAGPATRA